MMRRTIVIGIVVVAAWAAVVLPAAAQESPQAPLVAVEGRWAGAIRTPVSYSPLDIDFVFKQTEKELTGAAWPGAAEVPLKKVARAGNTITFEVTGSDTVYAFTLVAYPDRLEGEVAATDHGHAWKGTVRLVRAPEKSAEKK